VRASQAEPHDAPNAWTACPPLSANTVSTAYSGSTAMNARTAIASPADTSSCATSAAHDSRNAAPTIARPKATAATGSATWAFVILSASAGIAAANASARPMRPIDSPRPAIPAGPPSAAATASP
jgi:hypothetical protein